MYGEACDDSDEEEDVDEEGGGAFLGCLEQRRTLDVYLVPCQDRMPDIPGVRLAAVQST